MIRTVEPHVLQLFYSANNTMVTGSSPRTIVAPQALYFLNSHFVQDEAEEIGVTTFFRVTPGRTSESLSPRNVFECRMQRC